ncbi:MAG TPA: DUF2784 domain-containing protein [Gemmatimonadaceae bacterium]
MSSLLADLVVVTHLAFVLFVVLGGLLVLRWPRVAWLHIPAAIWGVLIEFAGWICPLTPLEQWLRRRAGEAGYEGGFIEHYVTVLIYPEGLTREAQLLLGLGALSVNVLIYGIAIVRWRGRRSGHRAPG